MVKILKSGYRQGVGVLEFFGLREYEPSAADLEREERRREYWSAVGRVAVGVFLGQVAFAAVAYAVFRLWLETL